MTRATQPTKIERKILRHVGRAIEDFSLIAEGDRILVAMSGGKDSYGLLTILDLLIARAPVRFEVVPWHLDQGQPGYDGTPLRDYLERRGGEFHIQTRDTYSIVIDKTKEGGTYCALCSRLRRGILYDAAVLHRCNKIALGHHADDAIETLLLNLLFTGQLKSMPPWLRSDDARNIVIRPLIYSFEADLAALSAERSFPILPCNLCGSQDGMQRQVIKDLVSSLSKTHPRIRHSMISALTRAKPSHLLDTALWKRLGLGPLAGNLVDDGQDELLPSHEALRGDFERPGGEDDDRPRLPIAY